MQQKIKPIREWLEAAAGSGGKKNLSARMRNGRPPRGDLAAHTGPAQIAIEGAAAEWIEGAAGDGDDDSKQLKRFTMKAYTGGEMCLANWYHPVVLNLSGLKVPRGSVAILLNHDRGQIVGHADKVEKQESLLHVEGVISGVGAAAEEVVAAAANRFPWRASVGAHIDDMTFIADGSKVKVNGKEFKGPVYVAAKATLGEVSFVPVGADSHTEARIAAAGDTGTEEIGMDFKAWLRANGFDAETVSDEQRKFLEAAWKAEVEAAAAADTGTPEPDNKETPPAGAPAPAGAGDGQSVQEICAEAVRTERDRVAAIEAACAGFDGETVDDLQARATRGELELPDLTSRLLGVCREGRTGGLPAIGGGSAPPDRKVLTAAAYMAAMVDEGEIIEACGEQAIEAAHKLLGIGFQEFCARAALLEGVVLPRYTAEPKEWLQAAFSTMSLPGILGNTTSKALLDGYNYVESSWRDVVAVSSVSDFKEHTRYRLTGDMIYQLAAKGGELQHATLSEQSFTQKADTRGIMFALTRQDIINDDMGAFLAIPKLLGMGAAEAINLVIWTLILSNPSNFFHADNSNYADGAGTALAIDSLTTAEQMFLDQTKPNGRPLGLPAKKLLVPTALKVTAESLMTSLELHEGASSARTRKLPTKNPHAGKFDVACSAYLSNSTITGNSALAWYLFADPAVLAAFEIAFLNGVQRPTVQKAEADFNTLGVQFRGFLDFGVKEQDPRGGVKMKGEA